MGYRFLGYESLCAQPSAIRQTVGAGGHRAACLHRIPSGLGDRVSEFCCADGGSWNRGWFPRRRSRTADEKQQRRLRRLLRQSGRRRGLCADSRHCLTDALVVDIYFGTKVSFSTPAGQITSSDYILDPAWDGPILDDGDLALIKLPAKITSVTSYELDTTSSAVGQRVILAGYGYTGVGSTGAVSTTFGTLRYGANVYDGVSAIGRRTTNMISTSMATPPTTKQAAGPSEPMRR